MFKPLSNKAAEMENNKNLKQVVRGPTYLVGLSLLLLTTPMILVAMFTNNWRTNISGTDTQEYYTEGLWFSCRRVKVVWLSPNIDDPFCSTLDYSKSFTNSILLLYFMIILNLLIFYLYFLLLFQ